MPLVATLPVKFDSREHFTREIYAAFLVHVPPQAAELLTAHVALSTGWGLKGGINNYRLAGIKAAGHKALCTTPPTAPDPGYDYTCNWTKERVNGVRTDMFLPFRSYNSLAEGAKAVVDQLRVPRYATSWQMLMAGDEEYFAQVGRDGWYTDDTGTTAAGMRSRLREIRGYLSEEQGIGILGLGLLGGAVYLINRYWIKR